MKMIKLASMAVSMAFLVGCASAPPMQQARPKSAQQQQYALAKSEVVARTDHTTKHLDEGGTVLYFQNQGGGGAGLGILLGPIGVMANIKMIDSVTTSDVEKIKGKLTLNPEAAFLAASSANSFAIQANPALAQVKVTPYMLVSKTDDTTLHVSSLVLFEGEDGQTKWSRRYQYQLPGRYTLDDMSALNSTAVQSIQSASSQAYASLLKQFVEETDESIGQERKISFKSAYMTPRFEFNMLGSLIGQRDGRTWVRMSSGVVAVDPADIQYQLAEN